MYRTAGGDRRLAPGPETRTELAMEIQIRLLAGYRRYLPEGHDVQAGYSHQVPAGTTVADVLAGLPIPPDDVPTFFVNGRHAERDRVLAEGDVMAVFPAAGGG